MDILTTEYLQQAISSGIIDVNTIISQVEMAERNKILENHCFSIYAGNDGKWHTYLPANTARGRREIKRKTRLEVEEVVIEYYKTASSHGSELEDVFYNWVDEKLEYGEIGKSTYDRYVADYNRFIKNSELEMIKLKDITELHIERFAKLKIKNMELTAKGWAKLRLILLGMFKYAYRHGKTRMQIVVALDNAEFSPKSFAKRTKRDEEQVFNDEEIACIIEAINSRPPSIHNQAIALALLTGMRVGEIVALRKEDFREDYLIVNKSETRYKENNHYIYTIGDAKTDAANRSVILTQAGKDTMHKILEMNPDGEYLFEHNGKRVTGNHVSIKLTRLCDSIGIPKRSIHKCRKTYATKLLDAGVDEKIIIKQMGHTDIKTTRNYYDFNRDDIATIQGKLEMAL